MLQFDQSQRSQAQQASSQQLLPQAYLTNFHNRIRNENVPMFVTAQPSRGHKRAKVVNYAEVDNDIFDELAVNNNSNANNDRDNDDDDDDDDEDEDDEDDENDNITSGKGGKEVNGLMSRSNINSTSNLSINDDLRDNDSNNINNSSNSNNNSNINLDTLNDIKNDPENENQIKKNDSNITDLEADMNEEFEKFKYDEDGNLYDNKNTNVGNANTTSKNLDENDTDNDASGKLNKRKNKRKNDYYVITQNSLPDIQYQDDMMSILRYPKIKATFSQSKIATPYRLDIPSPLSIDQQEPILIPINLNIEHNGHTIIDHFIWNVNDHSITPEEFATIYCRDIDFATSNSLQSQVVSTINDQIQENITIASVVVPDLHVIINLTCNLGEKFYEDNFQWNLNDKSLSPEKFAEIVVKDLGLTRDYISIISFSLHENILKIKKEWLDGQLNVDHVPNGSAFGYLSGIRLDLDNLGADWCPKVEILTTEEIQRREIEKERNLRRLKRESDRLGRRGRRRLEDLETTLKL